LVYVTPKPGVESRAERQEVFRVVGQFALYFQND
jgi:hypothetical protein